jgi:hypothetical protein
VEAKRRSPISDRWTVGRRRLVDLFVEDVLDLADEHSQKKAGDDRRGREADC